MKQHQLAPAPGSKRQRKRVGRGVGSGHGVYATRGGDGQKKREQVSSHFEGGQLPLYRRSSTLRGFRAPFRVEFAEVNVARLNDLPANTVVTPQVMAQHGLIRSLKLPVKVLGEGELTKALTVHAHRFSASAKAKIETAGGTVTALTIEAGKS
ncbi:MAG: 50S ribosomal protein L15 [Chloroflexi bacterium]|nr:50S ribosomal protein L15 [Chloroflexota bacterium]